MPETEKAEPESARRLRGEKERAADSTLDSGTAAKRSLQDDQASGIKRACSTPQKDRGQLKSVAKILKNARAKVSQDETSMFYSSLLKDLLLYGPYNEVPATQRDSTALEADDESSSANSKLTFDTELMANATTEKKKLLRDQKLRWDHNVVVLLEDGVEQLKQARNEGDAKANSVIEAVENFLCDSVFDEVRHVDESLTIGQLCNSLSEVMEQIDRLKRPYKKKYRFLKYYTFYHKMLSDHENDSKWKDQIAKIQEFHKANGRRGILDTNLGIGDTHVQDSPRTKRKPPKASAPASQVEQKAKPSGHKGPKPKPASAAPHGREGLRTRPGSRAATASETHRAPQSQTLAESRSQRGNTPNSPTLIPSDDASVSKRLSPPAGRDEGQQLANSHLGLSEVSTAAQKPSPRTIDPQRLNINIQSFDDGSSEQQAQFAAPPHGSDLKQIDYEKVSDPVFFTLEERSISPLGPEVKADEPIHRLEHGVVRPQEGKESSPDYDQYIHLEED